MTPLSLSSLQLLNGVVLGCKSLTERYGFISYFHLTDRNWHLSQTQQNDAERGTAQLKNKSQSTGYYIRKEKRIVRMGIPKKCYSKDLDC